MPRGFPGGLTATADAPGPVIAGWSHGGVPFLRRSGLRGDDESPGCSYACLVGLLVGLPEDLHALLVGEPAAWGRANTGIVSHERFPSMVL
jgi:hypothetical protein